MLLVNLMYSVYNVSILLWGIQLKRGGCSLEVRELHIPIFEFWGIIILMTDIFFLTEKSPKNSSNQFIKLIWCWDPVKNSKTTPDRSLGYKQVFFPIKNNLLRGCMWPTPVWKGRRLAGTPTVYLGLWKDMAVEGRYHIVRWANNMTRVAELKFMCDYFTCLDHSSILTPYCNPEWNNLE